MSLEQEKRDIEQTIQLFFDGFDNLDGDLVKKAFHSNAFLFDTTEEGSQGIPITAFCNNFLPFIKNHPEHPWNKEKCKKAMTILDITNDVAVVKAEWIFSDLTMTDYYTLIRLNSVWYITNKVWNTHYHK